MKKLKKLKKNFAINTVYLPKKVFNEPVYILNATKEYIEAYSSSKNKVYIKQLKLVDEFCDKTFISVKDFFKLCKKDNSEYKVKKVENGDIFIRVAYYGDLSLFFKISNKGNILFLTNIKKYDFYPTSHNLLDVLNKLNISFYEKSKIQGYLSNLKNLKRDYIFSLKKSKEKLENQFNSQK